MKIKLQIKGMHCKSCSMLIKDSLEDLKGIKSISISHETGTANIEFDNKLVTKDKIIKTIEQEGYQAK